MLNLTFIGSDVEKTYLKRVLYPNGRLTNYKNSTSLSPRDIFLDSIILGENILHAFSREWLNNFDSVSAYVNLLKDENDNLAYHRSTSSEITFIQDCGYLANLVAKNKIDPSLVISLSPKDNPLHFHKSLGKLDVFYADKDRILFGYAVNGSGASEDVPFIVNMFFGDK